MTLSEIIQTFEGESSMYSIKLVAGSSDYRVVVLTKNKVRVDGVDKVIIMIRDVTNKIKLE